MLPRFRTHAARFALVAALALACAQRASAQETDEFGDAAADPVKLFNQGQDAHAKKEYERALEFYDEALKLRPEFDAAESAALWRRATELKPDDATLWVARARAELAAKDSAAAARSFERAAAIDPSNVEARLGRADLALQSGDKARAVEDLRALEGQAKADWKLAVAIANRYGLAGQTEDARRLYDSLPDEAKNSAEGKRLLA